MDEPTSGLDPLMEAVFQQVVQEAAADGRTVLLSSHILAEVEALCRRVTIIRQGKRGAERVARGAAQPHAHHGDRRRCGTPDGAERALAALDGVHHVQRDDGHLTLDVDTAVARRRARAADRRSASGSLTAHPPTLEDLFLREYSDELATLGRARRGRDDRRSRHRSTCGPALSGTRGLVRVALRLDRWRTIIWAVAVAGLTQVSVSALSQVYATPESRQARAHADLVARRDRAGRPGVRARRLHDRRDDGQRARACGS